MMISQYFTVAPYPTRRASQPLPHFLERADARDFRDSPDRLAAVCESHRFVPVPELTSNSFKSRAPGVTTIA